ncbi:MAG TPA: glycosyltransferase family 1 protein, partial [Promineifilum sp.]|nr:glycosyltransferase family 1 protein [Promineifilum sp.]
MIAPTSFFSDYGGHIRILEETRALQARGVEVAIVTYYKGNDVPGIDIRR